MKCESIDGSYVGARSGEHSSQSARWIDVFVVVARSNERWPMLGSQQSLTSERGERLTTTC